MYKSIIDTGGRLYFAGNDNDILSPITPQQALLRLVSGDVDTIEMDTYRPSPKCVQLVYEISHNLDLSLKVKLSATYNKKGLLTSPMHRRGQRTITGATAGLYGFIATNRLGNLGKVKSIADVLFLNLHPAVEAIRFIHASGGDLKSLVTILINLGDIRKSYVHHIDRPKDPLTRTILQSSHSKYIARWFTRSAHPRRAATLFLNDDYDDMLLRAVYGNGSSLRKNATRSLFAVTAFSNQSLIDGLIDGAKLALELIVSQWLSIEYHPDLFDDDLLIGPNARKFSKIENQDG